MLSQRAVWMSVVLTSGLVGCTTPSASDDDATDALDDSAEQVDAAAEIDAAPPPPDAAPLPPDALQLACTLEELQPIIACAVAECSQDVTTECVTSNCGLLLLGVSPECSSCILTAVVGGDIAAAAGACGAGDVGGGLGG